MAVSRIALKKDDFSAGAPGDNLIDVLATSICPDGAGGLAGCEFRGGGFDGENTFTEQGDSWEGDAVGTIKDGRSFHPSEQYATVVVGAAGWTFSPGALVRCTSSSGDDYGVSPQAFFGAQEIFKHAGSLYTQLATGGAAAPIAGDTLEIEAQGSTIRAGVNGVSDVSTTDTSHPTGLAAGVYCFQSIDALIGGDFEGGNLSANVFTAKMIQNNWLRNRQGRSRVVHRRRLRAITSGV